MLDEPSTKPYLIRAIYEWCADAGYTPYLAVQVDEYTQVPAGYVKDGQIVLNVGVDAVKNLQMGNEDISCSGRFGGVAHQLMIPVAAVIGIFAKETGQGLVFQAGESAPPVSSAPPDESPPPPTGRPQLKVVK
ncbi:MAG: ClpXP protease specificity-enhancing factor [Sideroxydans sp.]|nr:ClpXP protease specificity-enhancing factor [Sideroxydans sp.]